MEAHKGHLIAHTESSSQSISIGASSLGPHSSRPTGRGLGEPAHTVDYVMEEEPPA